jgi:ATP-dependent RNA helicase DeaD
MDKEYYVHRIGRTARAGKKGHAFSFVLGREIGKLRAIEAYAATKIASMPVPSIANVDKVRTIPVQKAKEMGRYRQHHRVYT